MKAIIEVRYSGTEEIEVEIPEPGRFVLGCVVCYAER